MDDSMLRQAVLDELEFEPSIDAAHIGAAVDHGVVTLMGHVGDYSQKHAALDAVLRVHGVRGIADEIEVRYPAQKKTSDDEIATRAANILDWDSALPKDAIKVEVRRGWITLTGKVGWKYQQAHAEQDIRRLSGVVGVTNSIEIEPPLQATDVRQKIESAIKRRADAEIRGITILVRNDEVVLEGTVSTWDERMAVENAAWSTPGVKAVDDRIRIY